MRKTRRALIVEIDRCLARVRELFLNNQSPQDVEPYCTWGQFLDARRGTTQHGVYGTSAAAVALAASGLPSADVHIQGATAWLCNQFDDADAERHSDFISTHKLCWFLDAIDPGAEQVDDIALLRYSQALRDRQLPDGGWADHCHQPGHQDEASAILPTAASLWALRRDVAFVASPSSLSGFTRLRDMVQGAVRVHPAVAGMALLAASAYPERDTTRALLREIKALTSQSVTQFLKDAVPQQCNESYVHFYEIDDSYHYFHIPAVVVCLLAQLRSNPKLDFSGGVRLLLTEILQLGGSRQGFPARETGRLSTIDHAWYARLLKASREWLRRPPSGISRFLVDPSLNWPLGLACYLLLLVAGAVGIWVGFLSPATWPWYVKGLGILVSILGPGLFVNFLTAAVREKHR